MFTHFENTQGMTVFYWVATRGNRLNRDPHQESFAQQRREDPVPKAFASPNHCTLKNKKGRRLRMRHRPLSFYERLLERQLEPDLRNARIEHGVLQ